MGNSTTAQLAARLACFHNWLVWNITVLHSSWALGQVQVHKSHSEDERGIHSMCRAELARPVYIDFYEDVEQHEDTGPWYNTPGTYTQLNEGLGGRKHPGTYKQLKDIGEEQQTKQQGQDQDDRLDNSQGTEDYHPGHLYAARGAQADSDISGDEDNEEYDDDGHMEEAWSQHDEQEPELAGRHTVRSGRQHPQDVHGDQVAFHDTCE